MREVVVRGEPGSAAATRVVSGPHQFLADEPVEQGGTDTGPEPHELLLAALGTCTVMTLRMYAARKAWPLANVGVRLTGRRAEAGYAIARHITLEGALDDEQRKRLVEIADRCPVHRVLSGPIAITSTEEGGA